MWRALLVGVAALVVAGSARADFVIRAPFVHIEIGPAVVVRAPFVEVVVPRRPAPPRMRPALVGPPTVPQVPQVPPVPQQAIPPVPQQEARAVRPVTPAEFVAGFKPFRTGNYEVVFLHPHTNRPVKVNFELPVEPRRVNVSRARIDFRWGLLKGVSLHFNPDGTVKVKG